MNRSADQNQAAISLINSWMEEDEQNQATIARIDSRLDEDWDHLSCALDCRLSYRKLFSDDR